jgi:hypothetical protein
VSLPSAAAIITGRIEQRDDWIDAFFDSIGQ